MRKALVVGIDHYSYASPLFGCVNDAHSVKTVLERNADGTINFTVKLLTGTGPDDVVTRTQLKEAIRSLFASDDDVVLFYFAGHGHIESTGGYLVASDSQTGDDGLPLADVMTLATQSRSRSRVIILDSCHSGIVGANGTLPYAAEITEGTTILTASTAEQYASEKNGAGVFTTLLLDALNGAAANLVGNITPGSIYAHIDQSLGPWDQRPVFKTNVTRFVSLRQAQPFVDLNELHKIVELFPCAGFEFKLDPSYEPESGVADPKSTGTFAILQKFNRVNLVVPVDAPHMYHAAMTGKSCKLTVIGEHYRRLVERKRI